MDAYKKFTHKTPHLKGKQHQLDPNIDLKQLVHHAAVQYVDRDADGDVDVYDNPKKKTPDENPIGVDFGNLSKKLIAKQKGEIKHTKRGMAYEEVEEKCGKGMYWCNTNKECKPLPTGFNVPGQKIKPTEVGIGKPVEGACNHTKKGKTCPVHGNEDCSMKESKDHEYSMARSELSTVMNAVKRLQKKMSKGEGNVEAWVQSKITKAADYLDSAADYIDSGEMEEACWSGYKQEGLKKKGKRMVPNCVPTNEAKTLGFEIKKSSGAGALTPDAAKQLGDKAVSLQKKKAAAVSLPKLKENRGIVEDILNDIQEASKSGDASLHDWFAKSKSSDGKPGWVQLGGKYAGKPCAKQPGQTTKPKCGSSKMAAEMSPEEEERAAERKRREDPNPDRKGKAINVATEEYVEEDACKTKVKSRYKVWPSAYASGALVKCRKVGAANWGTKSESTNSLDGDWHTPIRERADRYCPKCEKLERRSECKYGSRYWDMFSLPAEIISSKKDYNITMPYPANEETNIDENYLRIQSRGTTYTILLNWRGKYITSQMFFQQFTRPTKAEVTREVRKVYPNAIVLAFNPSANDPTKPLLFTGEPNGPKKY